MYFTRITSMFNMIDAKIKKRWYSALHWAKTYAREGGTVLQDEWEEILQGAVMLDELGFKESDNIF